MNNRYLLYNKLIQELGALIGLPETGEDEDKTLRSILQLFTKLRDSQAPTQPTNPAQEMKQGGYFNG